MPRAVRLTFEYAGLGQPRLVSTTPLQKQVVASDQRETTNRSGFWFDVLHDNGSVLYRRVTSDPRLELDAPADDQGRMGSVAPPEDGIFTVVLPSLPGASRIEVWASRGGGRATVLLSVAFPGERV